MKKFLIGLFATVFLAVAAWASTPASRQYNFVDDKNNAIPITASRMDAEFDNDITKLNQKVVIQASAPSSPIAGMLWLDSTNKLLKQYRNSEWVVMGIVHIATAVPTTGQTGDFYVNTAGSFPNMQQYNGSAWRKFVPDGINWNSIGSEIFLNRQGVNWPSMSNNDLRYTGINWQSIPGDVTGNFIKSNGNNTVQWSPAGIPNGMQVFTGNGTWTKPAGVTIAYVKVWGAGGGGGGGGAADSGGVGGTGGTSSFAGTTTLQATGGAGGANTTAGAGGVGSNGTINWTGSDGGVRTSTSVGVGAKALWLIGEDASIGPNPPTTAYGFSSGGRGGAGSTAANGGCGGGAGGYAEGLIAVTGNVTVSVGTGGTAGSPGTSGSGGAIGKAGYVIVYW